MIVKRYRQKCSADYRFCLRCGKMCCNYIYVPSSGCDNVNRTGPPSYAVLNAAWCDKGRSSLPADPSVGPERKEEAAVIERPLIDAQADTRDSAEVEADKPLADEAGQAGHFNSEGFVEAEQPPIMQVEPDKQAVSIPEEDPAINAQRAYMDGSAEPGDQETARIDAVTEWDDNWQLQTEERLADDNQLHTGMDFCRETQEQENLIEDSCEAQTQENITHDCREAQTPDGVSNDSYCAEMCESIFNYLHENQHDRQLLEEGLHGRGLLHYRKWWELSDVDIFINGDKITGIPIFAEKNTLRVINDGYSYFIPLEKVDYIRTTDGLKSSFQN